MLIRNLLGIAALALVGAIASPAHAATLSGGPGQLFIGFRATGGTGASQAYLLNIGAISNYTATTPEFTLNLGNVGADLTALYGDSWYTRADLQWGIFGTTSTNGLTATLYASRERDNVNVQADPWAALTSSSERGLTAGQIGDAIAAYVTNGPSYGTNVSVAGVQSSGYANGYVDQLTDYAYAFGSSSLWGPEFEGNFGNGAAGSVLDIFKIRNTSEYAGSFTINEAGSISFNAVPEPSTYVLAALAGLIVVLARRRKTQIA